MQAAVFEACGEPAQVLRVQDRPDPQPGRGQVLVRMLASPVNPSDLNFVRGIYSQRPELPAVPGFEGAGIVEASGGGLLGRFLVGRRVTVLNSHGGNWAEQTVVKASQAIPVPGDIPVEQAAMFFVNPATAYIMTRQVLAVPRGAWLLQTAAGSALGRMVIRLGQHYGFRTLNIVRRPEQAEQLTALGANATLAFDPTRDSVDAFIERVRGLTGGGAPYAIDPVGGATASAVVRSLGVRGKLLLYGSLSGEPLQFMPRDLMKPGAQVAGFWLGPWMQHVGLTAKLSVVRTLTALMRKGVLVSEIGRQFPLAQVAEAVIEAERRGRGGKTLLQIGSPL